MLAMAILAAIELAAEAGGGAHGEERASASVRGESAEGSWTVSVESEAGPGAPLRSALAAALELRGLLAEARVVPGTGGLWLLNGALGLRWGEFAITARGRFSQLAASGLRGLGMRADWEHELSEATRIGLGAEAWALSLTHGAPRDPWLLYGRTTLDWAQLGSAGGWLAHDFGPLSLTPSLEVALPASARTVEARGAAAVELPLGSWKLRAQAAFAWAGLWLFEAGAGIARSWP